MHDFSPLFHQLIRQLDKFFDFLHIHVQGFPPEVRAAHVDAHAGRYVGHHAGAAGAQQLTVFRHEGRAFLLVLGENAGSEQLAEGVGEVVEGQAGKKERLSLLEGNLMETTQTIVDIYSRYLFESAVIEQRRERTLSVNELKSIMLDAQEQSYGDGLDPDVRHPYMWACKCHYYFPGNAFYNFPYAFGQLFGVGMFAQYQKEGASFVPKYNKLLRSCGSGLVADVAGSVGIDVRSADFWRDSLNVYVREIDAFIALADELMR